MVTTHTLFPGVVLRHCRDTRFKQGCLSIQLLTPMDRDTAAENALLPAVLLRGCREYRELRAITQRLDDLYGASVSTLVRRIGDYQATGLYCGFMDDRFALSGDKILEPMIRFAAQLLLDPVTEDGGFCPEYVESEKVNLISTIESERNDKRAYAAAQLLRHMCTNDSFGIPRLGEKEWVAAIDSRSLYAHYRDLLARCPIHLFYVGSAPVETVAELLTRELSVLGPRETALLPQTAFHDGGKTHRSEEMAVAQAKLCLGYTTPITNRDPEFAAMQVFNTLFGAGMTSKLFMNVREKLSLCYAIGSAYYGVKGLVTVSAGIDTDKEALARREIEAQLSACQAGDITDAELESAREALLSGLRGVHDSPGAIEGWFSSAALGGLAMTLPEYTQAVKQVTREQVMAAAKTVKLHSSFVLKGVQP